MSSQLGPQSVIYRSLSWITALIVANVISIVLLGPVFTGGLAIATLSFVCVAYTEKETPSLFSSLSLITRQGALAFTLMWLLEVTLGILITWEWIVAGLFTHVAATFALRALLIFVAFIAIATHIWVWPLAAHRLREGQQVHVRDLLVLTRGALLASMAALPRTVGVAIISFAPLALVSLSLHWGIRVLVWYGIIGIAFSSYMAALAVRPTVLRTTGKPLLHDEDD